MKLAKRQAYPSALEDRYARQLRRYARWVATRTAQVIGRALRGEGIALRVDEDPLQDPRQAIAIIERVTRELEAALQRPPLAPEPADVLPAGRATAAHAARAFRDTLPEEVIPRVGVNVDPDLLDEWADENVKLIKSVNDRYFDSIRKHIVEALKGGLTASEIAKVLVDRAGVAQSDAERIARDQISKLNGKVTQNRQEALGITEYVWSSSRDERVRPTHRKLSGTRRKWSEPDPKEGHPGSAVLCRCVAIAVLPDDLDDLDTEGMRRKDQAFFAANPQQGRPGRLPAPPTRLGRPPRP